MYQGGKMLDVLIEEYLIGILMLVFTVSMFILVLLVSMSPYGSGLVTLAVMLMVTISLDRIRNKK
jgi:hypothetical protein